MRDIIFRGRQKGGTEWFYGDLSYLVHDKQKCYIFPPDGYNSPDWYEVDSDTVGQYTGLKDKDGKKIFEGDLLKFIGAGCEDEPPYLVYWREFGWHTKSGNSRPDDMGWFSPDRWEVIGNRWDKEATP